MQSNAAPLALASELAIADSGGALVAEPTAGFDEGATETPPGTGVSGAADDCAADDAPAYPADHRGTAADHGTTAAARDHRRTDPTTESTAAP